MSIGIFVKQKNLIKLELRKEDADYELIYRKAKEKQFEEEANMDKIHWFESTKDSHRGYLFPYFKIYKSKGNWILFIFDDRPQSIPIESVRQGKIKAKKYLDAKIYEKFGE